MAKKRTRGSEPLRLEWWEADSLQPNPANWRRHPERQLNALRDVIAEVGWAGACLYNERTGRLIDGHARTLLKNPGRIPVLVGSWTEEQERTILATLDPIGAMATADMEALKLLVADVSTNSSAVAAVLEDLVPTKKKDGQEGQAIEESWRIVVICKSEQHQVELLEQFEAEGLECRALTL